MILWIDLEQIFLVLFYLVIFIASIGAVAVVAWFFEEASEKLEDWLLGKWR